MLRKGDLLRDTFIMICGDHAHPRPPEGLRGKVGARTLMLLPTEPAAVVGARASVFDIAPTLLEAAGICASPKLPWGRSLLSERDLPGSYPTESDLDVVRRIVAKGF